VGIIKGDDEGDRGELLLFEFETLDESLDFEGLRNETPPVGIIKGDGEGDRGELLLFKFEIFGEILSFEGLKRDGDGVITAEFLAVFLA
jgi:hypothetical protein